MKLNKYFTAILFTIARQLFRRQRQDSGTLEAAWDSKQAWCFRMIITPRQSGGLDLLTLPLIWEKSEN